MRSIKLNGWWRLWIFTTALLFLCAIGWFFHTVPTRESRIAEISYDFLMVQNPERIEERCKDNPSYSKCLKDWHYKDVTDRYSEAKSAALTKHIVDVDGTIFEDQMKFALVDFAVWLVVSLTLLLLGATIAWARRGLKQA